MYPLFISTFVTLITLLLDIRAKCRGPLYKYMVIFFLVAGIQYTFNTYADYDLFKEHTLSNQIIILNGTEETKSNKKSPREIKKEYMFKCKEMMDYHFEEACKCLKEAEEASFLLPNISEKDKANFCYTNIIATLSPAQPKYKIIGACLAMLAQYGSIVMVEWQRVDYLLKESKHHFEMEEHYRLTGKFIQDELNAEKK